MDKIIIISNPFISTDKEGIGYALVGEIFTVVNNEIETSAGTLNIYDLEPGKVYRDIRINDFEIGEKVFVHGKLMTILWHYTEDDALYIGAISDDGNISTQIPYSALRKVRYISNLDELKNMFSIDENKMIVHIARDRIIYKNLTTGTAYGVVSYDLHKAFRTLRKNGFPISYKKPTQKILTKVNLENFMAQSGLVLLNNIVNGNRSHWIVKDNRGIFQHFTTYCEENGIEYVDIKI